MEFLCAARATVGATRNLAWFTVSPETKRYLSVLSPIFPPPYTPYCLWGDQPHAIGRSVILAPTRLFLRKGFAAPLPPTQHRLPPCCYKNNTDHDDAGHGELPHGSPIARSGGLACEVPPPCGERASKGDPPLATPLAGTMISASNSASAYTKVSKSLVTKSSNVK